ncbi:MAG TPA: aerotolerance regulator BatA [Bacteroidales bacterium]|nr:MAG: aerotolerance regulator BatA [Bacteroidetes bacterium GWF2_33_38]OFY90218.1 MAG: aerotolerance regulator BatA [Bacteroidetes bacterium RIFOXYA2_FULL_33_7]HBF88238.1 aerotolerance regulator BatA [Bacteroidales bacterium]
MLNNLEFAHPNFFYLLLVLLPMIVWYIFRQKQANASVQISSLQGFENSKKTMRLYLRHSLFVLRLITIVFLIFVLARPQSTNSWKNVTTEGIDIIMAMDISSSMLAVDFKPDRLEAAKEVASQFISGRPSDRIGLVVFSGESITQCPLTTDHNVLLNLFKDIKSGMIEDGTAIGSGLGTSVNRLKDSKAISKVIILLTDGVNNSGDIAPTTAAEIAKAFGIRVYTIGVGSMGTAPYPVQTPFGLQYQDMPVEIDEDVLTQISSITGGKYFRATNKAKLEEIYSEIDKLEKSKIDVKEFSKRHEEFLLFAFIAFGSFILEMLLKYTWLKNIP